MNALQRLKNSVVSAITQEVFDSWDSSKKQQYVKEHPNTKFVQMDKEQRKKNIELKYLRESIIHGRKTVSNNREKIEQLKKEYEEIMERVHSRKSNKPNKDENTQLSSIQRLIFRAESSIRRINEMLKIHIERYKELKG